MARQRLMNVVRFRATMPRDGEVIILIINVEAQADFWPGYPLLKRGIYYGAVCCQRNMGQSSSRPTMKS